MWRSADGRMNSVAVPADIEELSNLRRYLLGLSPEERDLLCDELFELDPSVGLEIELSPFDEAVEESFFAVQISLDYLADLDWERLLGAHRETELSEIDVRWRLDVTGVVQQVIVELESHVPPAE